MPECVTCGAHISRQFVRVFADDEGDVHACPECTANAGISRATIERLEGNDS